MNSKLTTAAAVLRHCAMAVLAIALTVIAVRVYRTDAPRMEKLATEAHRAEVAALNQKLDGAIDRFAGILQDFTGKTAKSIEDGQRGINANLADITDPEHGHLAVLNQSVRVGIYGGLMNLQTANGTLAETAETIQAAIYGTSDEFGNKQRAGLLDVTNNTANLETQIGNGLIPFLDCTQQHHGNSGCLYSRWMALSGTLIKLAGTVEKATPQLLDNTTTLVGNVGKITGKYTQPCKIGCKVWDGLHLVGEAARHF